MLLYTKGVICVANLISDKELFDEIIDCSYPGLGEIKNCTDYNKCRKILAEVFRKSLNPTLFFSTMEDNGNVELTDELIDNAEKAVKHYVVSCGIPYDFKGEPVKWTFNPTENQYKEWTWQLSRHNEWTNLARAYRATKNEKYAKACEELFESWFNTSDDCPDDNKGGSSLCWRTIECGIRQGLVWQEVIHTFYNSFSDDTIVDWIKSVYQHGVRIITSHYARNWLIMEMNGLGHIGLLYPILKDSKKWYDYAMTMLEKQLDVQIYPDGMHYELATGYAYVVLNNYLRLINCAEIYGRKISEKMYMPLELLLLSYVKMMRPDGLTPNINDGSFSNVKEIVKCFAEFFPENKEFKWITGEGNEPDYKSIVFEYAGQAALRTGWGKDDIYLYFDGGPVGAGHRHEDKLSFILYANGKQILTEGNNYAYDTSKMREYVLSSMSHNTALVDGMGQNRRKDANEKWTGKEIETISELKYNLTDSVDAVASFYDEGYGEDQLRLAKHQRSLFFFKNYKNINPFVVVVDRFTSEEEHEYEIMWHIDSENLVVEDTKTITDDLCILVPKDSATLKIYHGEEEPYFQGWTADSVVQGDFRPIYNASYFVKGKNIRCITILTPCSNEKITVEKVFASKLITDTKIELTLSNGEILTLNEEDYI